MRKVYLEPNTDDDWGSVMDAEEKSPVQCWRMAAMDLYADQKRCHRGCAALSVLTGDQVGRDVTMHRSVNCLALPDAAAIGVLVDAPPEEA